ncbi:MAG: hypothetical protein U0N62_11415, partial [Hydrogeniiclostridium sp.]
EPACVISNCITPQNRTCAGEKRWKRICGGSFLRKRKRYPAEYLFRYENIISAFLGKHKKIPHISDRRSLSDPPAMLYSGKPPEKIHLCFAWQFGIMKRNRAGAASGRRGSILSFGDAIYDRKEA